MGAGLGNGAFPAGVRGGYLGLFTLWPRRLHEMVLWRGGTGKSSEKFGSIFIMVDSEHEGSFRAIGFGCIHSSF